MTALTFTKLFPPTVLTTSAATLYTCPASPTTSVVMNGRIRFTNTTAGAVTVTAYAVPSAGTAGVGNAFLNGQSIAANAYLDIDLPVLAAGDTFQALASAGSSITCLVIAGVVYS